MLELIISLDYEILGNGGGDVRTMVIEPTRRILDICDRHEAKLTIMFEVAEYLAFKAASLKKKRAFGYDPAFLMEEQAKDAIRRGHDVQLHIHPQWMGAELHDGLWHLNMQHYRIADLPNGYGSEEDPLSILGALYIGRKTLDDMLKPIKPSYECRIFRAGGYYVQPASLVIQAMRHAGLWADSSVVKGLHITEPWELDYRTAESCCNYWWTGLDDVAVKGEKGKGVLEFPVYSFAAPYYKNFTFPKLFSTLKRRTIEKKDPHLKINKFQSTPPINSLRDRFFGEHTHVFDFCKLSASVMVDIVKKEHESEILVVNGHNKDFWNDKNFDRFLYEVKNMSLVRFATFYESVYPIYNG
ncbi:hypothetical protein OOT00_13820 [Desulfobotulus sp. H1]|uniref:Polysaccharide deacetylase n=1 Tax=Desulfobotulus pelophilus TaxID=2823377 RepID=A0ABT3NC75_9BACT|nr:hypothetical protein [Desulfobotulus pelophilus]MCW7755062.1 hypothetical protein [Desulfobotulus pelophilus]